MAARPSGLVRWHRRDRDRLRPPVRGEDERLRERRESRRRPGRHGHRRGRDPGRDGGELLADARRRPGLRPRRPRGRLRDRGAQPHGSDGRGDENLDEHHVGPYEMGYGWGRPERRPGAGRRHDGAVEGHRRSRHSAEHHDGLVDRVLAERLRPSRRHRGTIHVPGPFLLPRSNSRGHGPHVPGEAREVAGGRTCRGGRLVPRRRGGEPRPLGRDRRRGRSGDRLHLGDDGPVPRSLRDRPDRLCPGPTGDRHGPARRETYERILVLELRCVFEPERLRNVDLRSRWIRRHLPPAGSDGPRDVDARRGVLANQTGNWVYPANFSSTPLVLAWMRGEASGGNKNIGLRLSSVTNHSATIFREQSGTAPGDTIEFLAFAGPMNLTARMTTRPNGTGSADTDGDKLTDGTEVNTYGSDPTLKDTDADGLNDSAEVTSRSISVPINGTLKTITFTTSPTSDDTDADGVKDPDELAGMLDHRVLYYDMETLASGSTFRDMSGSGADGVAKFVQLTSATPKKVGNATLFNGTTGASANRVLVPSTPWLNLTGGFTILVWVYPTTTTQTSGAGIVAKGYGNSASYILDVVTSGSSKVFRAYVGGSTYEAKSTTAIAANTWYQVAAVYDPTAGTVQLYVNLNAPVLRTAVPAISTNSHDLSIGSRESSSTSGYDLSFKGRLDEVQIWDRPLTLSQIRSLYNATTASYRARLDFETRTSAGQLFDFSGTYHRGVVTGTSVVEGRTGFARRLVGGTDGIVLSSSSGITIDRTTGATVDIFVLVSAMPTKD